MRCVFVKYASVKLNNKLTHFLISGISHVNSFVLSPLIKPDLIYSMHAALSSSYLKFHRESIIVPVISYKSPYQDPEHFKTWKKLVTEAADQDLKISEVISMLCL